MGFEPHFPRAVDSTMLSDFRECPRKFYYGYIRRLRGQPSIHLHAGGAYAAGLEAARTHYLLHKDSTAAQAHGLSALWTAYGEVQAPHGLEYKSVERVTEAFVKYFDKWPLESDMMQLLHVNGKPGVEFSFAMPLPINHPVTGDPILFGGRMDWLGSFNKNLFLVDEKTTSYFGTDWASKWSLRAQFMAYCYAARLYGFPVLGAFIRGVALKKVDIEFCEAGPLLFPTWKLDRWYEQTLRDVQRMVEHWGTQTWDWVFGDACLAYSGCPFQDLCRTPNDELWITPDRFQENLWSPLQTRSEPVLLKETKPCNLPTPPPSAE